MFPKIIENAYERVGQYINQNGSAWDISFWTGYKTGIERLFIDGKITDDEDFLFKKKINSIDVVARSFSEGYIKSIELFSSYKKLPKTPKIKFDALIQSFKISQELKKKLINNAFEKNTTLVSILREIIKEYYNKKT